MNSISQFLQSMVSVDQAQVLGYMVLANLILGSVAALKQGQFELAKFKDFCKRLIIVFGTYLGVAVASKGMADWTPLRDVAWAGLIGYLGTQIVSNVTDLIGKKLPDGISKWIERKQ